VYIRPGSQTGPSINICPNCHSPKSPNQALCTACDTRSCPNGHVMAGSARICAICNWVDPKARTQSSLFNTGRSQTRTSESKPAAATCPTCGNRVESGITQCPFCGNLVGSDYSRQAPEPSPSYSPSPEPAQRESVVVFQQSIGTHDKKRSYACPRCGSRIDNPRSGQCPNCGYVGSMQYDIMQRQPQWASPPPNNVPPPRYNPPPSQGYSSGSASVT
jgi:ribosomal protein L37E